MNPSVVNLSVVRCKSFRSGVKLSVVNLSVVVVKSSALLQGRSGGVHHASRLARHGGGKTVALSSFRFLYSFLPLTLPYLPTVRPSDLPILRTFYRSTFLPAITTIPITVTTTSTTTTIPTTIATIPTTIATTTSNHHHRRHHRCPRYLLCVTHHAVRATTNHAAAPFWREEGPSTSGGDGDGFDGGGDGDGL